MATTDTLWVMDGELETQLTDVRTRLNGAGAELRLFTDSDFDPDDPTNAEAVVADFTEPTLDGYEEVDLEDKWTEPARDEAGVWSMQTEIFTFTVDEAEEGTVDVYGVWIKLSTDVLLFALFDAPVTWEEGVPLRVRVVYTQYAALAFKVIVLS